MRRHVSAAALAMFCLATACSHASSSTDMALHQDPAVFSSVPVGSLPTPSGVRITPPAADLAPPLAAFSGTWQGRWDGQLPSRLIVERITPKRTQFVYVWGAYPGYFKAGWQRGVGAVTSDGKLQFDGPSVRFVFTMNADRKSIAGERVAQYGSATVTMSRVS